MKRFAFGIAALLLVAALAAPAAADTYSFNLITGNGSFGEAVESQFAVQVTDATDVNGAKVAFKFTNTAVLAASITDIYFDDGTLLGISAITDSGAGVEFANPATPGDLPGGNALDPDFQTTAGFSLDSSAPGVSANGVNAAGEFVTVTFNLINGKTFADTIAALNGGVDLRIGIHVQALPDGESNSYVNTPPGGPGPGSTPVPLPGVASAALALMAGLGLTRRR